MSLVVHSANCLSHQISGTLSLFCEGDPFPRKGDGMGKFRDELLLWGVLESLGIYKKTDDGNNRSEGKGMRNFQLERELQVVTKYTYPELVHD